MSSICIDTCIWSVCFNKCYLSKSWWFISFLFFLFHFKVQYHGGVEALCSVMSAYLFTDTLLSLKNYWLTYLLFFHLAKKATTDRCKENIDWAKIQSFLPFEFSALLRSSSEAPTSTWEEGRMLLFNAALTSSRSLKRSVDIWERTRISSVRTWRRFPTSNGFTSVPSSPSIRPRMESMVF